jgi:hypothetical protein
MEENNIMNSKFRWNVKFLVKIIFHLLLHILSILYYKIYNYSFYIRLKQIILYDICWFDNIFILYIKINL